jgi:hypothetical protein
MPPLHALISGRLEWQEVVACGKTFISGFGVAPKEPWLRKITAGSRRKYFLREDMRLL